ncbi:MAG: FKBP-type peptidyl-prolyl cis-trans isomerase [Candidatus Andeanibacterium colombiense]|uniref:Peptidyl-prolyl cis-trans isomerase n=1 Tax=Candidatus Andeanibacterium colombiense TaxID=3121345 RepID=A0AAJ6BQC7_9SPHN|nr:MAG: FKBP-type peptidyl-prolyl cis-trans isomerase [Sphingomonadaceae bacterium]
MVEVTQVPLQPVRKSSLAKVWIAVALAIVLGAGLAWLTTPPAVKVAVVKAGLGAYPGKTDVVVINYVGKLKNGTVFDQQQNAPIPLGQGMIKGFVEGLTKMQKGGKYVLTIPAAKAYGDQDRTNPMTGEVVIPKNSDLTFDIDVVDFMSEADFQRRMQMMQQLQQMQGGGAGGPGGAPGGAAPAGAAPSN